jgi:hypothetical protein
LSEKTHLVSSQLIAAGPPKIDLMMVIIELARMHYDLFLAACNITSWEHSILKTTMLPKKQNVGEHSMVEILCEKEEAVRLLHAAMHFYPEALTPVTEGLGRVL